MCSFVVLRSLFLSGMLLAAVSAAPLGPDGSPGSGAASLDGSGSTGSSGGSVSGSAGGSVPFDAKSPENPHWNSFLSEVASQTSRTLADLQATAATDPSIGVMWDVYVHSLGDGAALPSVSASLGASASNSAGSPSSGNSAGSPSSGSGSTAELPNVNQNWFQSFFKNPTGAAANSLSTNNFGSSSGGSMDQMFSRFRLPSSSGQSQQTQQSQPMPNSRALGQQFYSLVSPALMQSFMPQPSQQNQQNQQNQQRVSVAVPLTVRLPDTGWGGSGAVQQRAPTTPRPAPLSDAALQQLGDELLRLLGKTPADPLPATQAPPPPPPPPAAPQSGMTQFDLTNLTNSLVQSLTQGLGQSQPQPQTPPPPPPQPQPQPKPQLNTQMQAQLQPPNQVPAGPSFGRDLVNMPSNNNVQRGPGFGFPPGGMGIPGLPRTAAMNPMVNLHQARFKAGASRDLGCRTLGEIIDMDVPRPLNLNCPRLCPAMLGRAMTGKRFGLTCLCCPIFVSDQAIGFRSIVRQAESLA
ncbi:NHS-like protein 3 [Littorina saxatilis]|uniref:Uncharacterized protein n=1 Tax=Littorina saxatilis TaxID=31220 RepID=A0AAN9B691_9CAEN